MRAEWEPQQAVLVAWPHEATDWDAQLPSARNTFADLIRIIARHESVLCLVAPKHAEALPDTISDRVTTVKLAFNDTWTRDYGPLATADGHLHDFRFDGWGGKFAADKDDQVTHTLWQRDLLPGSQLITHDFVLEGGAVDSNGAGALLSTWHCLENRWPDLTRAQVRHRLIDALDLNTVHCLEHGALQGDDTDGHIDTLARFTDDHLVVYQACENHRDPHYQPLTAMGEELNALPFECLPLPLPKPIFDPAGQRLPAGYANFLIINDAVLVPVYADPADDVVLRRLDDVFTSRTIEPVDCRTLITQGGSLHCSTMQLHSTNSP